MADLITRTHWHHPEWLALAVTAEGWLFLLSAAITEPGMVLGGLEVHGAAESLVHSTIMSAAMMGPLVLVQVNHVAVHSLWRRRYRAAACYLSGYLGIWSVVMALMMYVGSRLAAVPGWTVALTVTFALAVGAVANPRRAHRLRQCLTTRPMAVRGWRADRDCALLGARMGRRCLATSWALMLAVTVQHGLLAMAAGTVLVLGERQGVLRSRQVLVLTVILGLSCLALVPIVSADG
jgi:hypothetical protein